MISLVFIILFALSFPSEGKINPPPEGNKFFVDPGSDVEVAWTFNDTLADVGVRQWLSPSGDILVRIFVDGNVDVRDPGKLLGVNVTKPATLILKNVDSRHNGKYTFVLSAKSQRSSVVTVVVKLNATVTTNCSSRITVDEGRDVRCLCKAQGENPPVTMKVTWYKDGAQIGPTRDEENMLYLINVNGTDNETYICKAKGEYNLTGESKSTELKVRPNFAPYGTSISPTKAVLGKSVKIRCQASARPEPTYTIIRNGKVVSNGTTYTIDVVKVSDRGSYQCIAKNKLGNKLKTIELEVVVPPPTTAKASTSTSSNSGTTSPLTAKDITTVGGTGGKSEGISGGAIAGIIIGVLVLLLIILFVVWKCKYNKEKESSGFSDNGVDPGNQGSSAPVANENAYESLADGEGKKPENLYDEARLGNDNGGSGSTSDSLPPVYATADKDKDKKKNKKKDKKKDEPAPANTPPVYATVDKTRHNEPSVTYATLDTVAMQPTGSSKRDRRDQPTEYASIAEFGVKGDLV